MPSELDLRRALDELGAQAVSSYADSIGDADVADEAEGPREAAALRLVDAPGRRSRLRPALAAAAVAAAIAVIAVGAVVVTHRTTHHGQPTTPALANLPAATTPPAVLRDHPCASNGKPEFAGFSVAAPGHDPNLTVCTGYRHQRLYLVGGALFGDLWLESPGVFDPALLHDARHVTGSGVSGYLLDLPANLRLPCPAPDPQNCDPGPQVLAWEYAPNAYAILQPQGCDPCDAYFGSDPSTKMLALAATVQANAQPMRLPMKLGWVPNGSVGVTATSEAIAGNLGDLTLGIPGSQANCPPGYACNGDIDINVAADSAATPANLPGTRVTVHGHPGIMVYPNTLADDPHAPRVVVATGTWYLDLTASVDSGVTNDDLLHIAEQMTLAPSADPSTWFDASTSLP